ncbi:MAG: hypothetical protein ACOCRK_11735 [bacterium]
MKINYSYVDVVLEIIDGKRDIYKLKNNIGFQTLIYHAHLTGNDFNLKKVEHALKDVSDDGYGLKSLYTNLKKIKVLYQKLKIKEKEWLKEVKDNVARLFNDIDYELITIYPVIGYDIGIGLNGNVCVNLNSEICLKDYREVVSIIIHETTHIYYDLIHDSFLDFFKIDTAKDMKNNLNKAIQYEGAGVFSSEKYRVKNKLSNTGSPIQEDYKILNNKDKQLVLFHEYKELVSDLMSGKLKNKKEFMERGFGKLRLTHRLGYNIFTKINEMRGIKGIKKAIRMPNKDFVEEFLMV